MIRSVAAVVAECSDGQYGGSAVVVLDGTYILTNNHVIEGDNCEYFACFTDSFEEEPTCEFGAVFVVGDPDNDLAVLQLIDSDGLVANSRREPVELVGELPSLGSELTHIGYPGLAGLTLTLTVGRLSGVTDECGFDELGTEYLKTDATGGPGMSGGGVFDNKGRYVGTHTAGCASSEERGDYSLVKPARYALALLQRIG
jgi:S1-C subfamily serine protease